MPTIAQTIKALETLKKETPTLVGKEAVTFFVAGFRKGGFTDKTFEKWKKGYKQGGSTLIGKGSGNLRDSIGVLDKTKNSVTVGSEGIIYAKIHNQGGVFTVNSDQRKLFWRKYYELVGKNKTAKGQQRTGKAASARSSQADMFKRMALSKTLKFPKRQFIGESSQLTSILAKSISNRFKELLKSN